MQVLLIAALVGLSAAAIIPPAPKPQRVGFNDQGSKDQPNPLIPLTNNGNTEFYADVKIGTPPQSFKLALDMTSSVTVVPSADCDVKKTACAAHSKYANTKSSSYIGDGTAWASTVAPDLLNGYYSIDTVSIGNLAVPYQTFAEATNLETYVLQQSKHDGVLGLALQNDTIPNTVLTNLVIEKQIGKAAFGLWLNNDTTSTLGGELSLGFDNTKRYTSALKAESVANSGKDGWTLSLTSIGIPSYSLSPSCSALISPAGPHISIPKYYADTLHSYLGGSSVASGQYAFDCSKLDDLPDVSFTFSTYTFSIKKEDYVTITDTPVGKFCLSAFKGNARNVCTFGSAFLRRWYSYFDTDKQTISFAPAQQ